MNMQKAVFTFFLVLLTSFSWSQQTQEELEQRKAKIQAEIREKEMMLQDVRKQEKSVTKLLTIQKEKIGLKENVSTYHVEMTRKITPIRDCIAVVKLLFYFLKVKPQIVHTHTPKAGLVGMLAAKLAGVPIRLHTVAGLPLLEATGFKRKVLNFYIKF